MGKRISVWLATAVLPLACITVLLNQKIEAGGAAPIVIDAVVYDGLMSGEPDEAVRIRNVTDVPIDVGGWLLTDGESTAVIPNNVVLESGEWLWLARNGVAFQRQFGHWPNFELQETRADIPNLTGGWTGLNNSGDQVMLVAEGEIVDCLPFEGRYEGECGLAWSGEVVQPYAVTGVFGVAGQVLFRKRDEQSGWPIADTDTAVDWAQDRGDNLYGRRVWYPGWQVEAFFKPFQVTDTAVVTIAIAPDNAYLTFIQQINMAQKYIQIEALSFENIGIAQALAAAIERGVEVTVLLEGAPAGGIDDAEKYICQLLEAAGGACWFMISDKALDIFDRYRFLHAKFVIIDGQRVIVSSENLSPNSLPFDDKSDGTWGRRGVIIVTDSPALISHFQTIFSHDFKPEAHVDLFRWQDNHAQYGAPPFGYMPLEESGGITYTVRYPTPLRIEGTFEFEVVQSPENSLRQGDGLLGLLNQAGAGDTILVQQLSERPFWGHTAADDPNLRLEAMIEAARRGATVQLLLDDYFNDNSPTSNGNTCRYVNQKASAEHLDLACRLANPTGLGIHNKMILVALDGKGYIHVGSLNGSEQASKGNREVALQIQSNEAYAYLAHMFAQDWPQRSYLPLVYKDYLPPVQYPLISELLYDPHGPDDAEFIEIVNPGATAVDLTNFSLSDAVSRSDFEDLRRFPSGTIVQPGQIIVVATTATGFKAEFGFNPDFEILATDTAVANLIDDARWGDTAATLQLANLGDELFLRDAEDQVVDVVVYGTGQFPGMVGCNIVSQSNYSLERFPFNRDTNNCLQDFREWAFPNPGQVP